MTPDADFKFKDGEKVRFRTAPHREVIIVGRLLAVDSPYGNKFYVVKGHYESATCAEVVGEAELESIPEEARKIGF
jgi:hypothetical protein